MTALETGIDAVIDLSHYNVVTSFHEVAKAGILGVIHKATQGLGWVDPEYRERKVRAAAAGLLWGAYHFGIYGSGAAQADHFLDTVNPGRAEQIVLDFEENPQGETMTVAQAEAFVQRVHARTGRWPGLYSGEAFLAKRIASGSPLLNCWLWLARYGPPPTVPPPFRSMTMWQYTDGRSGPPPHEVPGVGRCDRSRFFGDEAALRLFWDPTVPGIAVKSADETGQSGCAQA